jgi:hypothetical protein
MITPGSALDQHPATARCETGTAVISTRERHQNRPFGLFCPQISSREEGVVKAVTSAIPVFRSDAASAGSG